MIISNSLTLEEEPEWIHWNTLKKETYVQGKKSLLKLVQIYKKNIFNKNTTCEIEKESISSCYRGSSAILLQPCRLQKWVKEHDSAEMHVCSKVSLEF